MEYRIKNPDFSYKGSPGSLSVLVSGELQAREVGEPAWESLADFSMSVEMGDVEEMQHRIARQLWECVRQYDPRDLMYAGQWIGSKSWTDEELDAFEPPESEQ